MPLNLCYPSSAVGIRLLSVKLQQLLRNQELTLLSGIPMSLQYVASSALAPYHHIILIFPSVLHTSTHDVFGTTDAQQTAVPSCFSAEVAEDLGARAVVTPAQEFSRVAHTHHSFAPTRTSRERCDGLYHGNSSVSFLLPLYQSSPYKALSHQSGTPSVSYHPIPGGRREVSQVCSFTLCYKLKA